MGIVLGFGSDGELTDPADQGLTPTDSYTVQPGQTVTETTEDGTTHTYQATTD
jgi:hypothetical protein